MKSAASARSRIALAALGAALLGASGCRHDLEELYCDGDCPTECDECAEAACGREIANCLEDDACTEQLACECSDPGCVEECRGRTGMAGFSPFFFDVLACKSRECHGECRVGQKWECTGEYQWPDQEANNIEQRVRFGVEVPQLSGGNDWFPAIPLAGVSMRVCESIACGTQSDVLDVANSATVELATDTPDGTFRGFFELESPEVGVFGTRIRTYFRPISRAGLNDYALLPEFWFLQTLSWLPSPEHALLYVYVSDCVGLWGGARLRVRLPKYPKVKPAHYTNEGTLSTEATETTRGLAVFPYLSVNPPEFSQLPDSEQVAVEAVLLDDDGEEKVVARREVSVRKGWTTTVHLAPLAKGE